MGMVTTSAGVQEDLVSHARVATRGRRFRRHVSAHEKAARLRLREWLAKHSAERNRFRRGLPEVLGSIRVVAVICEPHPSLGAKRLERAEASLVIHFAAARDPVAKVKKRQAE